MEKLRDIDDIIEEIESEVSKQINKEAYEATESIKDNKIQFAAYKLIRDFGIRGMRLFMEKLNDKGIL